MQGSRIPSFWAEEPWILQHCPKMFGSDVGLPMISSYLLFASSLHNTEFGS